MPLLVLLKSTGLIRRIAICEVAKVRQLALAPTRLETLLTDALTIAKTCAKIADDIQAEEIVVLDLRGISNIADYFVICTATSVPHLKAAARDIRHKAEEQLGESPRSADGDASSLWIVIDYVDVVVHIFHEELRDLYRLEDLWSDAPRVPLDFLPTPPVSAGEAGAVE